MHLDGDNYEYFSLIYQMDLDNESERNQRKSKERAGVREWMCGRDEDIRIMSTSFS